MKHWVVLAIITSILLAVPEIDEISNLIHPAYYLMIAFFTILSFVLLRIDSLIPAEWKTQASLIKMGVRFLASLIFIGIAIYQYEKPSTLVIQFILIYLIYLIFEIVVALTNLRRN